MKKTFYITLGVCALLASKAMAQTAELPADPWAAGVPHPSTYRQQQQQQVAPGNPNIPKRPQYKGENTTFNMSMGQATIAPEVNISNILIMTDHLRKLGYQIPISLDRAIARAPEKLKVQIMKALADIQSSSNHNPLAKTARFVIQTLEAETGLSIENLLGNSLDILSGR